MKRQTIVACAFIRGAGNTVLIAKRAPTKKFLPDKYELPGGHVEFGEIPEDALKRELVEEMEIAIETEMPFYTFSSVIDNGMDHYIEILYFAHLKDGKQRIKLKPEDHSEFRWVTEAEVSKYYDADDQEGMGLKRGFEILKTISH